jgi:hypothetical protein
MKIINMAKKCQDGAQGMTFGIMDAIINVIGILIGLGVVGNKVTVILGILVAGLANSFGNAAGFHVSEETEGIHTRKEVWLSTLQAFVGTFSVTFLLLMPPLFLELFSGIMISVAIGIALLMGMGIFVGKRLKCNRKQMVNLAFEYTMTGILVIIASYLLGSFVITLI